MSSNTVTVQVLSATPTYGVVRVWDPQMNQYGFVSRVQLNAPAGKQVSSYKGVPIYSAGTSGSTLAMPYLILNGNVFTVPSGGYNNQAIGYGAYAGQTMEDVNGAYTGNAPY